MTDYEIAKSIKLEKISVVAKKLGLGEEDIVLYGSDKAKINFENIHGKEKAKIVLVTAMNPTRFGEGKTTVSIGLADAMNLMNKKTALALREPSLGPVFGVKGGAAGGGFSQVVPMEDINLHFTGDFHAITSANNLLCAMIDNHIFYGNKLNIDENNIFFNRCMDMNDRSLRSITVSQSGLKREVPRKDAFNITAASEIMAILCLCNNLRDLKHKLANIIVAQNKDGEFVYAKDLKAENAMAILLKGAIKPNLVQSLGGTPCFMHLGPFANIAHGCNSIIATKTAARCADYVVTEAGFGADLGAEKFLDIKCQIARIKPSAVVIVATIKALKLHGGTAEADLAKENLNAVENGMQNLRKHIENIKNVYGLPCAVAINKFKTDTQNEINLVKSLVQKLGCEAVEVDVWAKGGQGALELADKAVKLCEQKNSFKPCYSFEESIETKLNKIATKIYGAKGVKLSEKAKTELEKIKKLKLDSLPIVIAKTQYSLSDNPLLLNAPTDFDITIREFQIRNGSGFIVAVAGDIMLMPGLNAEPLATKMQISDDGEIEGLS